MEGCLWKIKSFRNTNTKAIIFRTLIFIKSNPPAPCTTLTTFFDVQESLCYGQIRIQRELYSSIHNYIKYHYIQLNLKQIIIALTLFPTGGDYTITISSTNKNNDLQNFKKNCPPPIKKISRPKKLFQKIICS